MRRILAGAVLAVLLTTAGCDGQSDGAGSVAEDAGLTTAEVCQSTRTEGQPKWDEFQAAGIEFTDARASGDEQWTADTFAELRAAGEWLAQVFRDHAALAQDPELDAALQRVATATETLIEEFADFDPMDSDTAPDIEAFGEAVTLLEGFCDDW